MITSSPFSNTRTIRPYFLVNIKLTNVTIQKRKEGRRKRRERLQVSIEQEQNISPNPRKNLTKLPSKFIDYIKTEKKKNNNNSAARWENSVCKAIAKAYLIRIMSFSHGRVGAPLSTSWSRRVQCARREIHREERRIDYLMRYFLKENKAEQERRILKRTPDDRELA